MYESSGYDRERLVAQIHLTKKAVFTDERKLEQRKAGFERNKNRNFCKKTTLSEFI